MKYIKTYESWRQAKYYFRLPFAILEKILSKLINYVPFLNLRYDELAAKIDFSTGLTPYKMKDDINEISLDDIKNNKLRNSLKATGLFSNWNIYYSSTKTQDNKDKIYISKDKLEKGNLYYSQRLDIDDKNSNQIYVIAAVKTSEHDEMQKERDERYNIRKDKALEKAVNLAIKENHYERSSSFTGEWNNEPILFKVVRADRIDLFNKIINNLPEDKVKKLVSMKIDNDGWVTKYFNGRDLLSQSKSKEMTDLIMSILYTPEELEEMKMKKNMDIYNL